MNGVENIIDKEADYTVPALQRGLRILELFTYERRELSTNEIAEALGVTVSTIYRIIQTLQGMGYLQKTAKNSYELGPQLISRGFTYLASRDIVDVAMPHLNRLRDLTSLSCHLSIREHLDTLYVYRALAAQRLSVNIPLGTRIPCHCNAMGKILLTALSETELNAIYQNARLDSHTLTGPKTLPELKIEVEHARYQGWVISRSDYATAIAAGVYNHLGQVVAAINISGADAMLASGEALDSMRIALISCAREISLQLGYKSN